MSCALAPNYFQHVLPHGQNLLWPTTLRDERSSSVHELQPHKTHKESDRDTKHRSCFPSSQPSALFGFLPMRGQSARLNIRRMLIADPTVCNSVHVGLTNTAHNSHYFLAVQRDSGQSKHRKNSQQSYISPTYCH